MAVSTNDNIVQNLSTVGVSTDTQYVANFKKGGQLGLGINAPHIDASAPMILIPVHGIVIHCPTMYDDNVDMQILLKNIMECHSKSISGIGLNYQVDFDEVPIGHDGQNMSIPKGTKRAAVNPNYTFTELMGNPIWGAHRKWITDYSDADTKFSMIGMNENIQVVPSAYSLAKLFIQFDPTGRPDNIIDAWIISNMFPEETGDIGSEKNIGESKTMERSMSYRGVAHHSKPIIEMAKEIATEMSLHTIKYYETAKTLNHGVDGIIPSAYKNSGVAKELQDYLES